MHCTKLTPPRLMFSAVQIVRLIQLLKWLTGFFLSPKFLFVTFDMPFKVQV